MTLELAMELPNIFDYKTMQLIIVNFVMEHIFYNMKIY